MAAIIAATTESVRRRSRPWKPTIVAMDFIRFFQSWTLPHSRTVRPTPLPIRNASWGRITSHRRSSRDFGEFNVNPYCAVSNANVALDCCVVAASGKFPAYTRGGFTWFLGDFKCTAYNHAQEPNGPIPDAITRNSWVGIATARSHHPGGVNALMADGAVRSVQQTLGRPVWRALGTRNGDELVE